MKNSIKIAVVAALAVAGIAACTPTESAAPPASTGSSTPETPPPSATVVTETVTSTVTNPPKPETPAKPMIDSFGYGKLKIGMTRQQALDTKLISEKRSGDATCTLHDLVGTTHQVWISAQFGVVSIGFTPEMTKFGLGKGSTAAQIEAQFKDLSPAGPSMWRFAAAEGNANARFAFGVRDGQVVESSLERSSQNCFR